MSRVSIKHFLEDNTKCDENFNFYDWFCKSSTLEKRMKSMIPKLKFLVKENIINPENTNFWLKNNCPVDGTLYDDLRINSLDGEYLGGFCPRTGHNFLEDKCSVWTINNGKLVEHNFTNWREFKKEVLNNQKLKSELRETFYRSN